MIQVFRLAFLSHDSFFIRYGVRFSFVNLFVAVGELFVRSWFLYSSFSGTEKRKLYTKAAPRMTECCSYDALGLLLKVN